MNAPHDRLKQFVLPRLWRMMGKPPKQYFREFWALKDVSFEIKKGETVGIVGRNGSGKSTLLQMICGTLNPTSGNIQTNGRVAALLELGSGFNPEFTGRENVYMNAAVLGLSNEEIDARFDDIAAFADIGEFIEQPVKTYSSGMFVRLAFAVAINVDPEILIVDEALSVGDELFQRKCFSRIEAIKNAGATILFVSHSGTQIVELCDRAILIDEGAQLAIGMPKKIVGRYQKLLYAPFDKRQQIREQIRNSFQRGNLQELNVCESSLQTQPMQCQGNDTMQASFDPHLKPTSTIKYESHGSLIEDPQILTLQGERVNNLVRGETYRYTYTVKFTSFASKVRFGMLIKSISGVELGGAVTATSTTTAIPFVEAGNSFRVEFRFTANLTAGIYFMNAGVVGQIGKGEDGYLHRLVDIAIFRISQDSDCYATAMVDFGCVPEIELIEA